MLRTPNLANVILKKKLFFIECLGDHKISSLLKRLLAAQIPAVEKRMPDAHHLFLLTVLAEIFVFLQNLSSRIIDQCLKMIFYYFSTYFAAT